MTNQVLKPLPTLPTAGSVKATSATPVSSVGAVRPLAAANSSSKAPVQLPGAMPGPLGARPVGGFQTQGAPAPAATVVQAPPTVLRLKSNDPLFNEGDQSRAMYLVRKGMLRVFKKKGESAIELDVIRAGSIIGELAFLDGNSRSASAEAITESELVEITAKTFDDTFAKMPEWLRVLLKTVVARLRTAGTRIRQLESASTAVDYSDKDKGGQKTFVFVNPADILKICSTVLFVASRYGQGTVVKMGLLQKFANQIYQIPVAKVLALMESLIELKILEGVNDGNDASNLTLIDEKQLEQFVFYLNDENLLETSKRHDISDKGFLIIESIYKSLLVQGQEVDITETPRIVNIAKLRKNAQGKELFRLDEIAELVKVGYFEQPALVSGEEANITIKPTELARIYRMQRLVKCFEHMNTKKKVK